MVEFHQPKKRRGIAGISGRSTRAVEAKPYWPGLEIDEDDRNTASPGSNKDVDNRNEESVEPTIESPANEDKEKDDKRIVSIGKGEGSSTANSNGEEKGSKRRSTGDISIFRSRKRKRKLNVNDNLARIPKSNGLTGEEQDVRSNPAKAPPQSTVTTLKDSTNHAKAPPDIPTMTTVDTTNEVIKKCAQPVDKASELQSTVTTPKDSTNQIAAAKATDDNKKGNTISPGNPPSNKTGDQSSVSSSDTKSVGTATPRTLVNFLVKKKIPILDKVVSDIRDVLFGMVSRSPALLQKHLAEASQSSFTSTGDAGLGTQAGNDHMESGRKQPPQQDNISKFEEICKRQEKLLDRIVEMELAAAKREEEFRKQIQEQKEALQQQNDQRQSQQDKDLTANLLLQKEYRILEKANASLKMKLERRNRSIEAYRLELHEKDSIIEGLEESKLLMKHSFQSRVEEQFGIIEKHTNSLKIERKESEKLRNRILVLEIEKSNQGVEAAEADNLTPGVETVDSTVVLAEGPSSAPTSRKEHQAYSQRTRHRHANGQQVDSLQSTNGSSRKLMDKAGITYPSSPTSPAFSSRIRRTYS
eukprot:CAMPEP_0116081482 /NCGR_PEP_ID=MMETSP0327-20121206/2219_1 /TAXON_ID=44447 /ORGANISM="Pseudo-nitzschia delicatissima, Strain B596" /LENGTH=584 /DNA_ID=CAMNT_0003572217 /DNA_START=89 /DNA_END=1843 /DNA_ORIENTATION=-